MYIENQRILRKIVFTIFSLAISTLYISAQDAKSDEEFFEKETIYNFGQVDKIPEYPGGTKKIMEFINKNLIYPKEATKIKSEGRVIVQFTVGIDGVIKDAHIKQNVNYYLDEEALRIVSLFPKWTPGKKDGKYISVYMDLPVRFRLPKQQE